MSGRDVLHVLLDEAERFAEPALEAAQGPASLRKVFADAGWDLDAIAGLDVDALGVVIDEIVDVLDRLLLLAGGGPMDFEAIAGLLGDVADAAQSIDALAPTLGAPMSLSDEDLAALGVDLLDFFLISYMQRHRPLLLQLLVLVGLADPPQIAGAPRLDGRPGRLPTRRPRLALQRAGALVDNPAAMLSERWLPADGNGQRGLETQASADLLADILFPQIAILARAAGAYATFGVNPRSGVDLGAVAGAIAQRALTIRAPIPLPAGAGDTAALGAAAVEAGLTVGATVVLTGRDQAGLGVVVLPHGQIDVSTELARWTLGLKVGSAAAQGSTPFGFAIDRNGITVPAGISPAIDIALALSRRRANSGPAVQIGSEGTRLEIGSVAAEVGALVSATSVAPFIQVELLDARIVVTPGDGDSFLKAVLPPGGLQVPFQLGMRWSQAEGLTFTGGASLEVALPVGVDLGFLKIPVVNLSLGVSGQGVALGLAATAEVAIGPVAATIERMGVAVGLAPPRVGAPGVAGPVDVTLRFLPPKGIGMSINAGPVAGGGYIFLDPAAGEYAGVLHLQIAPVSATAVGVLQTRLPGGRDGFSLVMLIFASFPPIQLGYGFTLNGLGGLVGINRAMNVDALRDAVRSGAVGSLLFPVDPVPRARQIIADVNAIFPPAEGQFVFGPMVKLGWGTPPIIIATLAVVIQIPTFVIAIIGRLQLALPEEGEAAVLLLRIDVVGVIDPGRGEVSIDGSLSGSRLAAFAIDGDFALRMRFGPNPMFALSAGGFHPRYPTPPGVPELRRLSISLATSDNPRLRLEAYQALTPATLQFGARVQVYAAVDLGLVGFFELDAELGFDVLLVFNPFGLDANLHAHITLRRNGSAFLGVELTASLNGPSPWKFDGRVKVKVAFVEVTVHVHHEIGEPADLVAPPQVSIAAEVRAALGDARSWRCVLPEFDAGVRIREAAPGRPELIAHPLGEIEVRQRLAPMNVALEKVGEATVIGAATVVLNSLRLGRQVIAEAPTTSDMFAPGQFFHMSEDQKLTGPAFEAMASGRRAGVDTVVHTGAIAFELTYEDRVVDAPDAPARVVRSRSLDDAVLRHAVAGGVGARAPAALARRFAGPSMGVAVTDPSWSLDRDGTVLATYETAAEARVAGRGKDAVVNAIARVGR
ncbi:DUF6603 domain-containing protein [Virgisporangium aurantiacum]|uniref:DUF6603 domain-containing protein n=1 Tax=Virgisporangium aurantiacum TaxID=175570 RepID=A0A8J4E774_9ACTN|nr:DUF6603 domain-containing protein [Virgisporangium aurantiacum]GIJ64825.1 hypothetical protein Vau01_123410 [Virgisporangium aurantiacum]